MESSKLSSATSPRVEDDADSNNYYAVFLALLVAFAITLGMYVHFRIKRKRRPLAKLQGIVSELEELRGQEEHLRGHDP